jgi:hypothetical protein
MLKRRRAALVTVVLAALVAISIWLAFDGGGTSTDRSKAVAASLQRLHRRNLQLESILLMLRRQQRPDTAIPAATVVRTAAAKPTRTISAEGPSESATPESNCDPSYEGACLDPTASDYDCKGGSGDGPDYTGVVTVVGEDHFGLDADRDGVGCESE